MTSDDLSRRISSHIDDEKLAGDLELEENVACRLSV